MAKYIVPAATCLAPSENRQPNWLHPMHGYIASTSSETTGYSASGSGVFGTCCTQGASRQ